MVIETGMIGGSLKITEGGLHYGYREHEQTRLIPSAFGVPGALSVSLSVRKVMNCRSRPFMPCLSPTTASNQIADTLLSITHSSFAPFHRGFSRLSKRHQNVAPCSSCVISCLVFGHLGPARPGLQQRSPLVSLLIEISSCSLTLSFAQVNSKAFPEIV